MNKRVRYCALALFFSLSFFGCSLFKNDPIKDEMRNAYKLENSGDLDELDEAGKIYKDVIYSKIEAGDKFAYVSEILGQAALAKKQYPVAVMHFSNALSVLPSDSGKHYFIGVAYGSWAEGTVDQAERTRLNDLAEKHLRYAIGKLPEAGKYRASLATLLSFEKGAHKEAMDHINTALATAPNNPEFLLVKAGIETRMGNYAAARNTYERVQRVSKNDAIRLMANNGLMTVRNLEAGAQQ